MIDDEIEYPEEDEDFSEFFERPLCYCDGWSIKGHVHTEEEITMVRGDLPLCPDCLVDYFLDDDMSAPRIIETWDGNPINGFVVTEGQ